MSAVISVTGNKRRKLEYHVEIEHSDRHPDLAGKLIASFRSLGDARSFARLLGSRISEYEDVTYKGMQ